MIKFLFGWLRPAPDTDDLFHALRELGYLNQNQTGDVVELVEAWLAGENLSETIERINVENEDYAKSLGQIAE